MRASDINIKGFVSADRQEDYICLFGKLEWHMGYHPIKDESSYNEVDLDITKHAWVTVIFEGLPCADLLTVYDLITKANMPLRFSEHHNAAKIPGIRIRVNTDVNKELFYRAIRQLFAIAFSEIPEECKKRSDVVIDDKYYPAE